MVVIKTTDDFVFRFDDVSKMVSHWLLEDGDTARLIAETPEWNNAIGRTETVTARVTVNGIDLPFNALEHYLRGVYKSMERDAEARYKDLDAEVQRRVELRFTEEAQPIIDKLRDVSDAIENAGDLIKPYWARV
jgi:hypothetical protein